MKVLMITNGGPVAGQARTTVFLQRQADFLRRAGLDVDVFNFEGRQDVRRYARAWRDVQSRVRSGRFDLVHAQFGQSGVLAFPKRLPLVVTLRGDDIQGIIHDEQGTVKLKGKLLQRVSQWVAARADAVIVVSDHMRAFVNPRVPVYTVPSGLDFDMFRLIPRDEARRHLGLPPDTRLVLFAGNPDEARKRYAIARQAVDVLNQTLPADLVVAWGVQHAQMPYYMNACDALIFTSVQEGSPNVVKEALACNLPVVSVPVGDVAERLAGVEGCELCDDTRPAVLAAALERVLRSGRRSRGRAAVQHLDEKLLAPKVLNIYRSVLPPELVHATLGGVAID